MAGNEFTSNPQIFRWIRTVAIAISILLFAYAGFAAWKNYREPPGVDFVSFWAAGRLTTQGQPALAYDHAVHREVELSSGHFDGLVPFPYPPPYLLLVWPFGALPFWAAFPLWVGILCGLFYLVFRRFVPRPFIFAHPALLANVLVGQNGMLTSSIISGGLSLLNKREWIGGAVLGAIIIKPQLGMMLPVAMVAGRYWRAILSATVSASLLLLVALALFGVETYLAFFAAIPEQAALMSGRIPWPKIASLYGAMRTLDVPAAVAMTLHVLLALTAASITGLAWWRRYDTRVPILAAASLLASPYLFIYDTVLLLIPIGWLVVRQKRPLIIILLWALSAIALFTPLPDPSFLAAVIALAVMWREGEVEPTGTGLLRPVGDGGR